MDRPSNVSILLDSIENYKNRDFHVASTSSQSENRGFVPIGSHALIAQSANIGLKAGGSIRVYGRFASATGYGVNSKQYSFNTKLFTLKCSLLKLLDTRFFTQFTDILCAMF